MGIASAGRNVDGIMGEYNAGILAPKYTNATDTFYNSNATFDLGIITNTSEHDY
jgi:hypothetical protein